MMCRVTQQQKTRSTMAGDDLAGTDGTANEAADNRDGNDTNDGSVTGELGDSVKDLGEGVGNAVEDVGDAARNAVDGR